MKLKRILLKIEEIYEKYIIKLERGHLLKHHFIYKNYLRLLKGFKFPPPTPKKVLWRNTTLKTKEEVDHAIEIIKNSKLNLQLNVPEKNWDSLIALNIILQNTDVNAVILDAGGQIISLILFWLYQLGYCNLKCLNLIFEKEMKRGKIEFIPGDLTNTDFPDNFFDIITCISVVEHGVNEEKYFKEMHRILKKGGLLITSTDYWESKLDKINNFAYNNPVFVYDKESIQNLLKKAYNKGFKLFGPEIDLSCQDKVVHWKRFSLKFTFLIFCLQKK
jgi:hypothetical protein